MVGVSFGSTVLLLGDRRGPLTPKGFSYRRQTRTFVIANTVAYPRYHLQITTNHGAAATQLAAWELLG